MIVDCCIYMYLITDDHLFWDVALNHVKLLIVTLDFMLACQKSDWGKKKSVLCPRSLGPSVWNAP